MESSRAELFHQDLLSDLRKNSKPSDKAWQERYMKGIIIYLGVKVPQVRKIVSALMAQHELAAWSEDSILELFNRLLASDFAEEKLAGVLVLASKILKLQNWEEQLESIMTGFQSGQVADWATCDQVSFNNPTLVTLFHPSLFSSTTSSVSIHLSFVWTQSLKKYPRAGQGARHVA